MKKIIKPEVSDEVEALKEYDPDSKEEQIKRAAELAAVPIHEVAKLAASLKASGDDDLDAAIKAYSLLGAVYEGKRFLAEDVLRDGVTDYSVGEFLEGQKGEDLDDDTFIKLVWGVEKCRTLENGNVAFEDALKLIIPNGKKGGLKTRDRISRLSRWFVEDLQLSAQVVDVNLPSLFTDGIDKQFLREILKRFPKWWAQHLKNSPKKAGSLGGKATQSGKGRVRNKITDKRIGPKVRKKSQRKKKAP